MKAKLKKTKGYDPPRNWVVRNPLMKKGGVHEKTEKAKRTQSKQDLKQALKNFRAC